MKPYHIRTIDFGIADFQSIRRLQEELLDEVFLGESEALLFGEHPSTLSLGLRADKNAAYLERRVWKEKAIQVVNCDRGGDATYHGPGQLVIYPVLSLRRRGIGVRFFVSQGLELIASVLREFGIEARANLDPAGVWICQNKAEESKIAAVGLRIKNGITLHGFSININPDLDPYSDFPPCGKVGGLVTSVAKELEAARQSASSSEFAERGFAAKRLNGESFIGGEFVNREVTSSLMKAVSAADEQAVLSDIRSKLVQAFLDEFGCLQIGRGSILQQSEAEFQ